MAAPDGACSAAACAALRDEVERLRSENHNAVASITELERQFNEVADMKASMQLASEAAKAREGALEKRVAELTAALAETTSREEAARAAAHKAELSARHAAEERDAATATADMRQREIDRLAGARCPGGHCRGRGCAAARGGHHACGGHRTAESYSVLTQFAPLTHPLPPRPQMTCASGPTAWRRPRRQRQRCRASSAPPRRPCAPCS